MLNLACFYNETFLQVFLAISITRCFDHNCGLLSCIAMRAKFVCMRREKKKKHNGHFHEKKRKKRKKTSESAQKDIQHLTRSFMQPHFHLDHQTRGSAACVDAAAEKHSALQPQLLQVIETFATSAKNYPNVSLLPHGNHVITTVRQAAPNVHWRGRLAKAYPVL